MSDLWVLCEHDEFKPHHALVESEDRGGVTFSTYCGCAGGHKASPADLLAAVRAAVEDGTIEGEVFWWCVPFQFGTMDEPCVAGSTHDRPHECRWVLVIPVSDGGSET
jgi:hypothetical protein